MGPRNAPQCETLSSYEMTTNGGRKDAGFGRHSAKCQEHLSYYWYWSSFNRIVEGNGPVEQTTHQQSATVSRQQNERANSTARQPRLHSMVIHRSMQSLARTAHYCPAGWTRIGRLHARFVDPMIQARPMIHMSTLRDDILGGKSRQGLGHAYRAFSNPTGFGWCAEFPRPNSLAGCPIFCLCVVGSVLNHIDRWPGTGIVDKEKFSSMCADKAHHL